jgi:TAT (twin-arginine translocation) pathway signal sequence
MDRFSRRSFVKVAGVTAGAAAVGGAPALARAATGDEAQQIDPTTGVPEEPVVAYVRDVERGEITVVSGTDETTYRDRELARRLHRAASRKKG